MADYSNLKLTNLGLELLAKVQAGTTDLTFTQFAMGNGSLYFPGDVPTMAALVNEKMTRPVLNTVKLDSISCEISTIIATADLPGAGFDMSEIGLFATDPDVGQILYGVIYAGATADHIPASADGMAYDYVINLIVTVSDADQVTIVIDSATAATKEGLSTHAALVVDPTKTGTDKKHVTNTQAKKWEDHSQAAHAPSNANYYAHPGSHPPSMIAETSSDRFVSDTEKATWNGKANIGETSATAYRGDRGKTAYNHSQAAHAPSNANYYAHPGSHPPSMIAETSSDRFVSDTEKATWNGKAKLGATSATAYRGDRGTLAYNHSRAAHAPSNANYYTHKVSHISTRTTTGTWSITGLTIGKPLYIGLTGNVSNSPQITFKVTSGALMGLTPYGGWTMRAAVNSVDSTAPGTVIIPKSTTVTLSLTTMSRGIAYAYH